jgi:hypothetical protein
MKSTADRVMDKVRVRGRGNGVFTPKDFLDLGSRAAIDRALSRLVELGVVFMIFPVSARF